MGGDKSNKEAEAEIFARFSRIVKRGFTSLGDDVDGNNKMTELDALYQRPEFAAEKRILNDMNQLGLTKGIISGLACFAFLRLSPGAISRWMMKRRGGMGAGGGGMGHNPFGTASGYKLDPNPIGQQPNMERPGPFFRVIRFCLDAFVSVSIGAYASMYFLDKDAMMRQFSDIPLVEGRSLLSEELCGDFTREFRKFDRQTWDTNHPALTGGVATSSDDERDFRNTMQGFVVNCRRRAEYEDELRRERGMRSNEPVTIPPPGVPRSISVTLDDLLEDGEAGDESAEKENGDAYFDTYFDADNEDQDSFSK